MVLSTCRLFPAGGDEGNRTLDPLLAGQVLSQLSYTPIYREYATYFLPCFAMFRRCEYSQLPRPCLPAEKSFTHLLCKSLYSVERLHFPYGFLTPDF